MIKVVLKLGCHAGAAERSKRWGGGGGGQRLGVGMNGEWGVGVLDKEYLN